MRSLNVACDKYHPALVFVSLSLCLSALFFFFLFLQVLQNDYVLFYHNKKGGEISLYHCQTLEMNTLVILSICGSGSHQSFLNVFVRAVSLFSQLPANICPGSVVLGTWEIHEEDLLFGYMSSFKMACLKDGQTNVWTAISLPTWTEV